MKTGKHINCSLTQLPFNSVLSFKTLIAQIKQISSTTDHPMQKMAKATLAAVNKAPELNAPICADEALNNHPQLVKQLMAFVISPLRHNSDMEACSLPFASEPFFASELYNKAAGCKSQHFEIAMDGDQDLSLIAKLYQAYLIILEKFYNYSIDVDIPFTYRVTNTNNGSVKYLRKRIHAEYLEINEIKKHPKLSSKEIAELFDNTEDLNLWNSKIPLENFEFSGFMHFSLTDITQDFVISQLKTDLLDKKTIETNEGFEVLQKRMCALFENPQLKFGMAVAPDADANLNINLIWNTIIPRSELQCSDYIGSVYEKAFTENRIINISDLGEQPNDLVVQNLLNAGIRSLAIVPLFIDEQPVGMLEFACAAPDNISMFQIKRLHDVFPTFALALKRSKEEWNDKIRAVIQDEFTAIHPTIEWRFREAVGRFLSHTNKSNQVPMEKIVFPDVVPIYGAADIRGSSLERNMAIQEDLTEQLEHARDILNYAIQLKDMPLLDDICFNIQQNINTVKSGLKAGDEVVILEFLKKEVNPVLNLLKERYADLSEPVDVYFSSLDPELKVVYKKRRDFENSLTKISNTVSEIIDIEQHKAQAVFPHYFEKYQTDGVEYNAYIGQSLVKNLNYNTIYLKNIRLWQLLVKVKVARSIKLLQPQLTTKLDITQLILVHSNPLSIEFRQDEKKFDVAGAYNIRYEITKKRIDKARINGSNERITQVGKIAIIYSHADEIQEYKKYIDYLIAQGYLAPTIEELELEDLKGASGLRALRVEVNFDNLAPNEINPEEIARIVTNN
ncbi:GAF domain-containing protein [uncultured Draconibacterium sp.]|uniref:GAF domain-containing protein n=1 Tax=uncultured Draconibacterium sp. TaxID=1573823 RepID=UPI0025EE095C|nr:GAF domain-containing protein [uncultured Draconibacterium sp.]